MSVLAQIILILILILESAKKNNLLAEQLTSLAPSNSKQKLVSNTRQLCLLGLPKGLLQIWKTKQRIL